MSTSETRRGPGWWMDLEGQWNPPESWPESSPPLPGWTRTEDGSWQAPAEPPRPATSPLLAGTGSDLIEVEVDERPPPNPPVPEPGRTAKPATTPRAGKSRGRPAPQDAPAIELQFSEVEAIYPEVEPEDYRGRAITAAVISAVAAIAIAAAIVFVLALL